METSAASATVAVTAFVAVLIVEAGRPAHFTLTESTWGNSQGMDGKIAVGVTAEEEMAQSAVVGAPYARQAPE